MADLILLMIYMPTVSVIIPTYNHEKYINDAIDSVLAQSYRDIELIVVDDGSTDNTRDIVRSYGNRVNYYHKENAGVTSAMNLGFSKTKGKFISFLSSDDMLMADIIEKQLSVFETNPKLDLIYSDYYYVNEKGQILDTIKCPFFEDRDEMILWMFRYCYFMHDTVMFKREFLEKIGGWDGDMPYAGEYWMWFKCLKDGKVAHIPQPLVKYRVHGAQLTTHTKQIKRYRNEAIKRARKLYGISWSIKSKFYSNPLFGLYWLLQGLIFENKTYGLYWAKHSFGFGENSLKKYIFFKNKIKEITEKHGKEKQGVMDLILYHSIMLLSKIRKSMIKMKNPEL